MNYKNFVKNKQKNRKRKEEEKELILLIKELKDKYDNSYRR
jgi:hypothetical protein